MSLRSFSQKVLTEGDIVFTRINIDDESFSFVLLIPIANSTQFVITDEAWNGFTLTTFESSILFTATSAFLAGEEISISASSLSFTSTGSGTATLSSVGATNPTGGNMLGAAGDNLFIYQSTGVPGSNDFVTGINANGGVIGSPGDAWSTTTSSSNSLLPSGLTNGRNALGIFPNGGAQTEVDNARYKSTALRSGDKATILAAIMDLTNWEYDNSIPQAPVGTSFTITGGNTAPIATAPSAPTVLEDDTNVALANNTQVTDTDGDNQTITFTVTGGTVTLGTAGITFGGSGNGSASFTAAGTLANINAALDAATFTPTANLNGTNAGGISFIANDNTDNSNIATVTFTINAVNDEPSFTTGANEAINEDAGAQTINGWATAIDDGDADAMQTLTFIVTNDNNALFSTQPTIDATGNLTYTPTTDANGSATVSVVLADDGGTANGGDDTFATQQFTITVNAVNDEPSFSAGVDEFVNENAGMQTVNWASDIDPGAVDESGQILSFALTNDNNALFSVQPAIDSNGTLTYTLAMNQSGEANVDVVLSDDGGTANGGDDTFDTETFSINVSDITSPTVTITSTESSPTSANPIPVTVTFNEDVDDFMEGDIIVTGGTISDFTAVSATEYTFNINHSSILSNSTVTINVPAAVAQDLGGNDNEAATEFTIVALAPALHNETANGDLSNDANAPTMLTFATGSNRIIGTVTTSSPTDTRDYITFTIPTGMQLSQILLQNYDDPSTAGANDGNRGFHALDEGATTFQPGSGNPDDYLGGAHLDPLTPGTDVLSILASATIAGLGFTAPLQAGIYTYVIQQTGPQISDYTLDFIVETETIPPTVGLGSAEPNPTGNSSFQVFITFDEDITGFDISDIVVGNGTASNLSGGGLSYDVTITATMPGLVTVDVNMDSVTDLAGNGNTTATQFSIIYDNILSSNDELLGNVLTIYPIPSNYNISISGETNLELQQAEIFDIQGKLIMSKKLDASKNIHTVNISSIHSGIYFINIHSENSSTTKRIIKQ